MFPTLDRAYARLSDFEYLTYGLTVGEQCVRYLYKVLCILVYLWLGLVVIRMRPKVESTLVRL